MVPVVALSALTQWELLLGASFTHSFSQGPIHTEHLWEQGGTSGLIPDYHKTGNSYKYLSVKLEMPLHRLLSRRNGRQGKDRALFCMHQVEPMQPAFCFEQRTT